MINVIVKPDAIELPAGAVVRVPGTWQDYQALLEHLGDCTSPRIKYRNGELLLMVPLPEHGKQLDIIVDMVKVLLRHQGLRFDSYYETTMDLPSIAASSLTIFSISVSYLWWENVGLIGVPTLHRTWQ
jgi:hypothetical protein